MSLDRKYEQIERPLRQIFVNNFTGGIAWGLGATVGVSIIVAILGIVLKKIDIVPLFGNFASQVTNYVLQNNPHLVK